MEKDKYPDFITGFKFFPILVRRVFEIVLKRMDSNEYFNSIGIKKEAVIIDGTSERNRIPNGYRMESIIYIGQSIRRHILRQVYEVTPDFKTLKCTIDTPIIMTSTGLGTVTFESLLIFHGDFKEFTEFRMLPGHLADMMVSKYLEIYPSYYKE